MIWRFVQAFGASPALSVGVASIGDLYHIEQRGAVVGMFFSVCYLLWLRKSYWGHIRPVSSDQCRHLQLGVSMYPLGNHDDWTFWASGLATHYASWRTMQTALGLAGCVTFVFMFFFFPEPSHPGTRGIDKLSRRSSLVFVNPLRSLWLLRSPTLTTVVKSHHYFTCIGFGPYRLCDRLWLGFVYSWQSMVSSRLSLYIFVRLIRLISVVGANRIHDCWFI